MNNIPTFFMNKQSICMKEWSTTIQALTEALNENMAL